jgi:hypothetical protein
MIVQGPALVMTALGSLSQPSRWLGPPLVVRFARLIQRRVRVLGGPAVRAACGGNLSLPWWPRRVIRQTKGIQPAPPSALGRRYLIGDASVV